MLSRTPHTKRGPGCLLRVFLCFVVCVFFSVCTCFVVRCQVLSRKHREPGRLFELLCFVFFFVCMHVCVCDVRAFCDVRFCPAHTESPDRLFEMFFCASCCAFFLRRYQVKSRMQNQLKVEGQIPKYKHTVPSLITVISEEGLAAVYK